MNSLAVTFSSPIVTKTLLLICFCDTALLAVNATNNNNINPFVRLFIVVLFIYNYLLNLRFKIYVQMQCSSN